MGSTQTRDEHDAAGAAGGGTMRAVVRYAYGPVDALRLEEVARPGIGPDEVLVEVRAAGVDPSVWHLMTGLPYPVRLMGYGLRRPKNPVLGTDVAGVVAAVGSEVTRFGVGDEVFGLAKGSFAEYAAAKEAKLAPKPPSLDFSRAAAVPVSGITALDAVRGVGRVRAGQAVLVIGASGGVGTFAVQVAKTSGAEVTGVCRTAKADLVRSLGADHVVDYTKQDFLDGERRYDLVVDTGGNSPLSRLRKVLVRDGTLVIVGGEGGGKVLGGLHRQLGAVVLSPFVRQRLVMLVAGEGHAALEALTELVEAGQVTPAVDRTYPLAQAPAAVRELEAGRVRGKLVLTV